MSDMGDLGKKIRTRKSPWYTAEDTETDVASGIRKGWEKKIYAEGQTKPQKKGVGRMEVEKKKLLEPERTACKKDQETHGRRGSELTAQEKGNKKEISPALEA